MPLRTGALSLLLTFCFLGQAQENDTIYLFDYFAVGGDNFSKFGKEPWFVQLPNDSTVVLDAAKGSRIIINVPVPGRRSGRIPSMLAGLRIVKPMGAACVVRLFTKTKNWRGNEVLLSDTSVDLNTLGPPFLYWAPGELYATRRVVQQPYRLRNHEFNTERFRRKPVWREMMVQMATHEYRCADGRLTRLNPLR